MTRRKSVLPENVSRNEADESFTRYTNANAHYNQVKAKMDVELNRIREKHSEKLDKFQSIMDEEYDVLKSYAENSREEFGKKKSLDFATGRLGFRTGTPKLKTRRGFTWAAVLELLKDKLPDYVVTKEQPNKEKLLADRNSEELQPLLKTVGVEVKQDETFFVEPKLELVEA